MAWLILIIAMLGWSAPGFAQTKTSDKEWNAIVEAAKKEGKVVVAGSPDPGHAQRSHSQIQRALRHSPSSSSPAARVKSLRGSKPSAARVSTASMFFSPGQTPPPTTLYGEKMIDPLKPLLIMPEVIDGTKWKQGKIWFADPEERFVVRAFSSVATLLFINTDQVKPEEMRTAKDLLNPKWRGKISTEDPTTTGSGANCAARFYHDLGEDFVSKLYIEQKTVRTRERRQMTRLARARHPADLSQLPRGRCSAAGQGGLQDSRNIFELDRYARLDQRFAVDVDGREQGAESESGASLRQLDSLQEGLGTLCARLRLGEPAHRYRRVESQSGQFAEEGRQIFRRYRLEMDRHRSPRVS